MPSVAQVDFDKFLSEIGFSASNRSWTWLLDYKPTEEFVNWICNNVQRSNYLSDEELNEFKKLEESGLVLEGEELENSISETIPELFELPDIDDDYISVLKDELQYIQNHSHCLADKVEKHQAEVLAAEKEISELENKIMSQQNKLVNAQSECLGKSSSLESSLQQLCNHLVNLKKYCLNSDRDAANGKFLSELPIDDYVEESAAFTQELDMNMEQIIASLDMKRNCDISSKETFERTLKEAKKGLRDTLLLKVEETARRKGLESACKHVKMLLQSSRLWGFSSNHSSVIENLAEQKQNLRRLEARAKLCGPVEVRVQGSALEPRKLGEAVTKYVNKQSMSLEDLQKELQFHQKQMVCSKLRKLEEVLKNQCATDLVWLFLLGEEVTEVLNLFEFAKSGEAFLIKEQQDRLLRIESMKYVKEGRNCEINKVEIWCLFYVLLSYLKTSQDMLSKSNHPSVNSKLSSSEDISYYLKSIVEYIQHYEAENTELELAMKERSNVMISALNSRYKELAELKSLICSGSTENSPVIWPVNQLMFCFHSDSVSKKVKKRFAKLMASYQREKQKSLVQEDASKSLWKKFITNPDEVKTLINPLDVPTVLLNCDILAE